MLLACSFKRRPFEAVSWRKLDGFRWPRPPSHATGTFGEMWPYSKLSLMLTLKNCSVFSVRSTRRRWGGMHTAPLSGSLEVGGDRLTSVRTRRYRKITLRTWYYVLTWHCSTPWPYLAPRGRLRTMRYANNKTKGAEPEVAQQFEKHSHRAMYPVAPVGLRSGAVDHVERSQRNHHVHLAPTPVQGVSEFGRLGGGIPSRSGSAIWEVTPNR